MTDPKNMPTERRTTLRPMIAADSGNQSGSPSPPRSGDAHPHLPRGIPQEIVAVGFAVLLLVLATTSQGAFAISRWAPLALFVLAALLGALLGRRHFGQVSRPVLVAL